MRSRLSLLLLLSLSACHAPSPVLYQADGIEVSLIAKDEPQVEGKSFQTRVQSAAITYCWHSGPFGPSAERAQHDLSQVTRQGDFLLVGASCGGGNASKCQGFQTFKLSPKLSWLGEITGYWDGKALQVYDGTWFYDTGDMLEINELLSHASSPRYRVAYKEADGQLRFDAAKTWELNLDAQTHADDSAPGLLFKAGLAKLCGKTAELKAILQRAKPSLLPKEWSAFQRSMLQVQAGTTTPRPFLPVQVCEGKK